MILLLGILAGCSSKAPTVDTLDPSDTANDTPSSPTEDTGDQTADDSELPITEYCPSYMRWSPVTEDFEDYVVTMRQWYEEGLFENNFYGEDRFAAIMYDEIVGGDIGEFSTMYDMYGTTEALSDDPDFALAGLPSPLRERADTRKVAYSGCPSHRMEDGTSAIFTTCDAPEILAQFLDFFYSDEGARLANYGVEGESYTMPGIETFFNENVIKYIAGIEDMSTYDNYVQKMWDMGLQDAIDVQQTAYERFMARGK